MKKATDKTQRQKPRDEYNNLVKQVEIVNICLVGAKVDNFDYSYFPSEAIVKWRERAEYQNKEHAIDVIHHYYVTISDDETKKSKAKVSVVFNVTYSSGIPMNDEFFTIFKTHNLKLNTWPYFREFVHNIALRMGWPPFIAPTYVS